MAYMPGEEAPIMTWKPNMPAIAMDSEPRPMASMQGTHATCAINMMSL